ncbi:MAG: SDR family NAD(P)-dependent oxidoreductase [Defluviitaleaceae bacterium]|nr:SDR family NAD(P)-dependent oxidoreductase [Defluviitaleaceae bacterium]MCL2262274.1 SDR family NAD(P)-dependent oxidoreductase [Defluviitaleaceae bacterium]
MKKTILITNMENNFGKALTAVFVREGYEVFSPQDFEKIERLDYFAETSDFRTDFDADFEVSMSADSGIFEKAFHENVIAPMERLEKFLPLLEAGEGKRLFYVSSAEASINETRTTNGFSYKMSKAALHQFLQMLRNELAPSGFSFRVFDPLAGEVGVETAAESAFLYITRRRGTENHDPNRDDETNLVLRDANGRHHAW